VEDVFKRVRAQVRRYSEGRQVPWESTSLEDDFYFDPSVSVSTLAESERAREVSAELARERAEWVRIRGSTDPDAFVTFLLHQRSGQFTEAAELRLLELKQLIARAKPGEPIRLPRPDNRFALGDAFTYVHVDGYTQLENTTTWSVRFADDERVEFNNGVVLTQAGASLRDSRGYHYDPPRQNLLTPLQPGKTWRAEFKTWRGASPVGGGHWDYRVAALEWVTVPAGTFEAWRIETTGEADQGGLITHKGTFWVDQKTLLTVREDMLVRNGGRIQQFFSLRLASLKRAPRWSDR
jgi:hypothetical protein